MLGIRWIPSFLIVWILLLSLSGGTIVAGRAGIGNFEFSLNGYTLTGTLTNGTITHDGHVAMQMSVDQTIPISDGSILVTATGVWSGTTNFAIITGSIANVKGNIYACISGQCKNGNYTGSGSWVGTFKWNKTQGSVASGTFQGELNILNAPPAQSAPFPVTGNWTTTFST